MSAGFYGLIATPGGRRATPPVALCMDGSRESSRMWLQMLDVLGVSVLQLGRTTRARRLRAHTASRCDMQCSVAMAPEASTR